MKFVTLGLVALLLGTAGAAVAENLRIGASADYAPWESVDTSGEIVGFDRDVGDELCKRLSLTCTWANQSFDGLLPSLQVGKFDALMSAMSINEERAQMVEFTRAYADAPTGFVGLIDNAMDEKISKEDLLAGLAGKVVGVQSGTTQEQVLNAHMPNVQVRSYERNEQLVDDLRAGRVDVGMMELSAWEPFMEGGAASGLKHIGPQLTGADYPEFGQGQGIALKKGNVELKDRLDGAINEMLKDGTIEALSQKWFGYDVSSKM